MGADPALRVSVPEEWSEIVGAVLMERLGPYQELEEAGRSHLVFYPFRHGAGFVPDAEIVASLPSDRTLRANVSIERVLVPGGWEEGWKDHFRPLTVGRLYVRPPWEEPPRGAPDGSAELLDLVLTPGQAFGTGLHPTTRGMLELLQSVPAVGPVVDAGTGSGILSIAAVLLGYGPVRAFDDDPLAVEAARTNAAANGVGMEVRLCDVSEAPVEWFSGATVLANMTLEPVRVLIERLGASAGFAATPPVADTDAARGAWPTIVRLLAAGILAGEQEAEVLRLAPTAGLRPARVIRDGEWVAFDLRPQNAASPEAPSVDPAPRV